jgi:hypothetical protein
MYVVNLRPPPCVLATSRAGDDSKMCVQTEQEVEVHADLPGMKKEEIQVDIDNNVLTLKVDHEEKKEETNSEDPKRKGATTWYR